MTLAPISKVAAVPPAVRTPLVTPFAQNALTIYISPTTPRRLVALAPASKETAALLAVWTPVITQSARNAQQATISHQVAHASPALPDAATALAPLTVQAVTLDLL